LFVIHLRCRHPVLRVTAAAALVAALAGPSSASAALTAAPGTSTRRAAPAMGGRLEAARPLVATPGYYRPIVAGGKVFPVARSNFIGILEFPNSWHAPRLRLVNGKWLLIGVHEGIDITAERGTPILSMTTGVVEKVGWTFYGGTRVGVRGLDGRYYFYAHLAAVAPGIVPGVRVAAGEYLGRVGNTGYGTDPGHRDEFAPHLHFGIQAAHDGEWINPYPTLVSLYSATVRADQRAQAALDQLGLSGNRAAWQREAARLYMGLTPW
jgi:murein DD-endopeptidase MepM/ murein hydrolase activator NlpD